ncbi:hypothetical protein BA724_17285 [Domibacillus iocasae]|uniref:Uncharacterized protein n=1 Tax=Domibacillus iocasae TaxID=1714016 RepID=A0A1E7DSA9_9BACI|nr:hypothetical protein BA724_17285 [Domibacillus iocasae]
MYVRLGRSIPRILDAKKRPWKENRSDESAISRRLGTLGGDLLKWRLKGAYRIWHRPFFY